MTRRGRSTERTGKTVHPLTHSESRSFRVDVGNLVAKGMAQEDNFGHIPTPMSLLLQVPTDSSPARGTFKLAAPFPGRHPPHNEVPVRAETHCQIPENCDSGERGALPVAQFQFEALSRLGRAHCQWQ